MTRGDSDVNPPAGAAYTCRLCGFSACHDEGPVIISGDSFSGSWSIADGARFHLVSCPRCDFWFKDPPVVPGENLVDYYQNSTYATWGTAYERRFDLLEQIAARHAPGRRILDVGCSTGELLRAFGPTWAKFGVEPSVHTAAIARQNGVEILGPVIVDVPASAEKFDAVMLIDVAEHLVDPLPLFGQIRERLRPGGVCVVMTLDTAAITWKLERSRHWYCALPEHVSFYSERSMGELGRRTGFEPVEHRRVSHVRAPARQMLSEFARNAAFVLLSRTGGLGIRRLRERVTTRPAPGWGTARDHMINVMRVR